MVKQFILLGFGFTANYLFKVIEFKNDEEHTLQFESLNSEKPKDTNDNNDVEQLIYLQSDVKH